MAQYKISGIWKDSNNVITHYAIHTVLEKSTTRAVKMTKIDAVKLLETRGNSAITWVWDYLNSFWKNGEIVEVINGSSGKYLRTNPDKTKTDNLAHLIDYDWIFP